MYVFMLNILLTKHCDVLLNNNVEIMSYSLKHFLFLSEADNLKDKERYCIHFQNIFNYYNEKITKKKKTDKKTEKQNKQIQ